MNSLQRLVGSWSYFSFDLGIMHPSVGQKSPRPSNQIGFQHHLYFKVDEGIETYIC